MFWICNNNNRGDGGVTRVTGVTRGDGTEGGEEGKGESEEGGGRGGGREEEEGEEVKLLRDGTEGSKEGPRGPKKTNLNLRHGFFCD